MAKTTLPNPTKKTGQRSPQIAPYLYRFAPTFSRPEWYAADAWRRIVRAQPVAILSRETLIANIIDLDWKIEPRDGNQRDELKGEIDYYTQLFEYNGEIDWVSIIELLLQDYFDLPFGGAFELGWENDDPDNRLVWFKPLDGATLFPTLVPEWPVGQYVKETAVESNQPVFFPDYAINRIYMSPRPEIIREGWGMAPPEKIYLAIQMIAYGDTYYANLLVDTPEAGLLDLGDMSQEAAETWVESFRSLVTGIDPFKIPVLYEHTTAAKFIPFGRPPLEMTFGSIMMKYSALVTSGYGLSLSDIGIQVTASGGETLAGSIRQERKTRKTGLSRTKKAVKYFMDRMIDPRLKFVWIDMDDELNVALGRARLASATALNQMKKMGAITGDEARLQIIADGLMTIPMKEVLSDEEKQEAQIADGDDPERPGMLDRPRAPSSGGRGEVKQSIIDNMDQYLSIDTWEPVIKEAIPWVKEYISTVFSSISGDDLDNWDEEFDLLLFEQGFPEDLDISISHLNDIEIPEELRSAANLGEVAEKTVIFGIKECLIGQILEKELDINDIMIDNTVERSVLAEVEVHLDEIKDSILEKYKENINE